MLTVELQGKFKDSKWGPTESISYVDHASQMAQCETPSEKRETDCKTS